MELPRDRDRFLPRMPDVINLPKASEWHSQSVLVLHSVPSEEQHLGTSQAVVQISLPGRAGRRRRILGLPME